MFCIFDLDGTLLDTLQDLADSHNQALLDLGLEALPTDDYRFLVGKGLRNLCLRSLSLQYPAFSELDNSEQERLIEQHLAHFQSIYRRNLMVSTKPYPGIAAMLEQLKKAEIPCAVLSNKADPLTKKLIMHFFKDQNFVFIEGMSEAYPRKPDPTAALAFCAQLGLEPADCYFIGDTSTDMQTATNGGFIALGVSWGFRSREELFENGAVEVFDSPEDLGSYIVAGK